MKIRTALSTIYTVFFVSSATVYSYHDLRGKPCKSEGTFNTIPPERASWSGSITITIECDKNYDLPLNAPENSSLTCMPDGSTWQPDYLPDCNDLMFPMHVKFTMRGLVTKAICSALGQLHQFRNVMVFSHGLQIDPLEMCSRSRIVMCQLKNTSMNCTGDVGNDISGDKHKVGDYIFVELQLAYTNTITWSKYTAETNSIALGILRYLDPDATPSSANVTINLEPKCQEGTVAVLRAGIEVVCRGCSLGHYLDISEKKCLPCKPGYYGDSPLQTTCKLCPGISEKLSETVWQQINKIANQRVHDVEGCPWLHKYENGTIAVGLFSNVHSNPLMYENPWSKKDPSKDEEGFTGMIIGVAIICSTLAVIYIGVSVAQDRQQSWLRRTFEHTTSMLQQTHQLETPPDA